MHYTDDQVLVL